MAVHLSMMIHVYKDCSITVFKIAPLRNIFIYLNYLLVISALQIYNYNENCTSHFIHTDNHFPLSSVLRPAYEFCHIYFSSCCLLMGYVVYYRRQRKRNSMPIWISSAKENTCFHRSGCLFPSCLESFGLLSLILLPLLTFSFPLGLHLPWASHDWLLLLLPEYPLWCSCIESLWNLLMNFAKWVSR